MNNYEENFQYTDFQGDLNPWQNMNKTQYNKNFKEKHPEAYKANKAKADKNKKYCRTCGLMSRPGHFTKNPEHEHKTL